MKKILFLFTSLISTSSVLASNYYWVGGTGNWSDYATHWATSSGGTVFHVTIPSPNDDVFFDANSFLTVGDTLYLDTTITNCRTMDWGSVANNPVLDGMANIHIYGSLLLSASINWPTSSAVDFTFSSAFTGNLITTAGHPIGSFAFDGTGGSWRLNDVLTCSNIFLQSGTFISDNFDITCDFLSATGASNKAMLLGTSTINCNGDAMLDIDNLTLDADSTDFIFSSNMVDFLYAGDQTFNNVTFYNEGIVQGDHPFFNNLSFLGGQGKIFSDAGLYQKVIFTGNAVIANNNVFDTLVFNNPGKTIYLQDGDTVSILSEVIADGNCSQPINIQSSTAGTQAIIYKNSGNVNWSYLIMKDINTTGGATFSANNTVDLGNNSGCTIISAAPRNLYWVGGNGNWSDPNHWSLSSAGAGGNCMPAFTDDVFFDGNSFAQSNLTLDIDVTQAYCNNMNWTGVANNPTIQSAGNINVYGSLTLSANITWAQSSNPNFTFRSTQPGNSITTAGIYLESLAFDGTGGSWRLNDILTCSNIFLQSGTFISDNFDITCDFLSATGASNKTMLLGTSTINCNGDAMLDIDNLTLDADSTDFIFSSNMVDFLYAGDQTFNNVTFYNEGIVQGDHPFFNNLSFLGGQGKIFSDAGLYQKVIFTGNAEIANNNVFDTLVFNNPGKTIYLQDGDTVSILSEVIADGNCSQPINIQSSTAGTQAIIYKNSGNVNWSYLIMKDINTTGGATFSANNTVDLGNNSGCTIISAAPRNLYWVGGNGNWSDPNHWSLSSAGAGGNCMPAFTDDVFFDGNSFAQSNLTLDIDVTQAYCNNMNWTGVANNPTIQSAGNINVYGSLTLSANITWAQSSNPNFTFRSTQPGNSITTAGIYLESLAFDGTGGSWRLNDVLTCSNIFLQSGTFISDNFDITCDFLSATGASNKTMLLGTSTINCNGDAMLDIDNLTLDADSTDFIFSSNMVDFLYAGDQTFNNVTFYNEGIVQGDHPFFNNLSFLGGQGKIFSDAGLYQKVIFTGNAVIANNNVFDTLVFNNPGKTIYLQDGDTISINNILQIQSNPGFPTSIQCDFGTGTISKLSDTVCTDFIYLKNITATGGAVFFAGDHSVDLGGNTGWNWTRCTPLISNVWPGDCNYDLIVDNFDLLNIGVSYGDTGYVRPGASLSYTAQLCQDWYYQFINTANVKHADCDGNGIVDGPDSTAISLNYGLTHPARFAHQEESNSLGAELSFDIPPVIVPGSSLSVPITLGTSAYTADNVYGIAFTVDYDPAFIQPGTMSVTYSGSWVENSSNHLHLEKDFPGAGKTDIAFTRIDHADVSGFGMVATLNFIVSPNADGPFNLSFSHVRVISHNEIEVPVQALSGNTYVGIEENSGIVQSLVYPNPMSNITQVTFYNPAHHNWTMAITDITGMKACDDLKTTGDSFLVERNSMSSGVYFYTIQDNFGKSSKGKLIVQ